MATARELDAMRQAIALSALGLGTTSPNPPVGAVILDPSNRIVGTGYHKRKGEAHAEPQALAEAGPLARGGIAVVTLEPCNHIGITPACRQALIDAEVARVVIAIIDPTSRGEGGAAALRAAGIEVEVGVLEDEALHVLEPWLVATQRRRPFVTVVTAVSAEAQQDHQVSIENLRGGYDVIVYPDNHMEEGVPNGHGVGMLRLPRVPFDSDDPMSMLAALQEAGARTVLAVGNSAPSRSIIEADLADRLVIDLPRDFEGTTPSLPAGYRIDEVAVTGATVRVFGSSVDDRSQANSAANGSAPGQRRDDRPQPP